MQPLGAIGRLFHVFYRARRPHFKIIGIHPAAGLLRYYFSFISIALTATNMVFLHSERKKYKPLVINMRIILFSHFKRQHCGQKRVDFGRFVLVSLAVVKSFSKRARDTATIACPSAPRERACIGRGEGTD